MFPSAHSDVPGGLPPFDAARILTQWALDPVFVVGLTAVTAAYVVGVQTLRARGDAWAPGRTVAFVSGMAVIAFATLSGLGAYDTVLLSVHMVQHMLLSMLAPLLLALGAPVTLMLRTLPSRPRAVLLRLLHSRLARVLTFAPLTLLLFVISPWALYFTGWYDATLSSELLHNLTHVHLVLIGSLFFWPMVGIDPVPGRVAYPFRLLTVFLTLPFHAFLGVTIMGQERLIGGDWYPHLPAEGLTWLPDAAADQHLAGGILWGSGDLIGLAFLTVLFVQWVRDSTREAAREDRRLDRLERR